MSRFACKRNLFSGFFLARSRFFMQKKLIALLVTGLVSGAVFAQGKPAAPSNNVTLYGRLDLAYVYSKSDFRKFQGIDDGLGAASAPSILGFRGEEALGGGLKAIYMFEWGIMADTGEGPGQNQAIGRRYTYVGLAGNFGSVTIGRQVTPMENYMIPTGIFGTNGIKPFSQFRGKLSFMNPSQLRWDNSIAYNSPNFSGLEFMGMYSFGERVSVAKANGSCTEALTVNNVTTNTDGQTCADTADAGKLALGVKYTNGPLYLTAFYEARADDDSYKPVGAAYNPGYGAKGWGIGGGYDFKVVRVYANYVQEKASHGGLSARTGNSGNDKQAFWTISAGIPVSSAGTVMLEYGQYKDYLNVGGLNPGMILGNARRVSGNVVNQGNAGKSKGFMVGYRHGLSRRTSLYAYASQFKNDDGITGGWVSSGTSSRTSVLGEKQTNFVAGIVHNF
jgi:predicted porin